MAFALCQLLVTPARAHAQAFVNPFVHLDAGGRAGCAGQNPHEPCEESANGLGVAAGYLHDTFGVEVEGAEHQNFFGRRPNFDSSLFTLAGHAMLFAPPAAVRLFALAGSGLTRTTTGPGFNGRTTTSNALMASAGAGALGMIGRRIGIRGDLRYVHIFDDLQTDLNLSGQFVFASHFWQTSVGAWIQF